jgi:probable phosphoglycerate mutase
MGPTFFVVVRHGETEWNREGRYQGHLDSPLTLAGQETSRALADRLARHSLTALYSSDLGRARQTAQMIAGRTGHDVLLEERLRERNLGILEGLTKSEVQQRYPEEYRRYRALQPDFVVPRGESVRQRFAQVVSCFEELAVRHENGRVVVVTHGGALNAMLRHTLGIPLDVPRRFAVANGSWNQFLHREGRWLLETWGDLSHLDVGSERS